MGPRPMVVTFRRSGRTCAWEALRPPRTVVPGPTMAAGAGLPHDLATFVVERALGIAGGFWDCVAEGATFRSLGRKRTPQGKAVIARHIPSLDDAERRVNELSGRWRAGQPTPATADLDDMLRRWRALEDGEAIVLEWPRRPNRSRGRSA